MNPKPRIWGRKADGTLFTVGLTVRELRDALAPCPDNAEVCMFIDPWRGIAGKVKKITTGSANQIWIESYVVDESLDTRSAISARESEPTDAREPKDVRAPSDQSEP